MPDPQFSAALAADAALRVAFRVPLRLVVRVLPRALHEFYRVLEVFDARMSL